MEDHISRGRGQVGILILRLTALYGPSGGVLDSRKGVSKEMGNRTYRPSRYEHPTETDPRVFSYLQEQFGTTPNVSQTGADLIMSDGTKVEVKSTQEWHKSSHSRGKRRRGRFCLHGYEECDFMLFVICRQNGDLEMYLFKYLTVLKRFGVVGTINWRDIVN